MNKLSNLKVISHWLGDINGSPSEHPLLEFLDQIYTTGPSQKEILNAQSKLQKTILSRHELFVFYDSYFHPQIGEIFTAVTEKGLIAIDFGLSKEAFISQIETKTARIASHSSEENKKITEQLRQYFQGQRQHFELAIDFHQITEFQNQVYRATSKVPYGQVVTYADIARKLDKPGASRAVGQALRRNPIPFIIPCHRVIASDGSLRGYKGNYGLEIKATLLKMEGCQLPI